MSLPDSWCTAYVYGSAVCGHWCVQVRHCLVLPVGPGGRATQVVYESLRSRYLSCIQSSGVSQEFIVEKSESALRLSRPVEVDGGRVVCGGYQGVDRGDGGPRWDKCVECATIAFWSGDTGVRTEWRLERGGAALRGASDWRRSAIPSTLHHPSCIALWGQRGTAGSISAS